VSLKERNLSTIDARIRALHQKEAQARSPWRKSFWWMNRWANMLQHEFIKDDVAIRAESLSYLSLFSIMPILAGIFLLLTLFSGYEPVQHQFQYYLNNLLAPIPDEHRKDLLAFILDFKEQYLAKITQKSTSIAVFAFGVLIWISGKVFFNMENLMNRIWLVSESRPWLIRIRNLIFSSVIFPVFVLVALSLPHLIRHFYGRPGRLFAANVLPALTLFFGLVVLFRYFPNVKVRWPNALKGAVFSTFLFELSNYFLKYYFHFGTQTAYGKAAVLPIMAFFIYVIWLTFILGAEVSFILQNENLFVGKQVSGRTLGEALLLSGILEVFAKNAEEKRNPPTANELAAHFKVSLQSIHDVLFYLREKDVLAENPDSAQSRHQNYMLLQSHASINLGYLIKDYLNIDGLEQNFDVKDVLELLAKK
jgi:membrane protein